MHYMVVALENNSHMLYAPMCYDAALQALTGPVRDGIIEHNCNIFKDMEETDDPMAGNGKLGRRWLSRAS